MSSYDVVVIGAGAAGLAALQVLDKAGLRVVVLEARDRIGGRIFTVHDPLSALPLELGAEFVHGRPPEIWNVIREAGLVVYDGTDQSRYMNNGDVDRNADSWNLVDSVIDDMRAAAVNSDQTFEEFLHSSSYDEETKEAARGYIEGFNAAESNRISIQALAEEITAADQIDGDLVFRFARGYDAVAHHLLDSVPASQSKLRLNTVVEKVTWHSGSVSIDTRHALSSQTQLWRATKAIVTVPLGVLQAGSIMFSPEPVEMLQALRRLQFGQVYRIVLRFRQAFWESRAELKDAGFILSREVLFPTWWTSLAIRSTILTGWSAGAHAEGLKNLTREQVLQHALKSLARITGFTLSAIQDQLESMYFHDWHQDVYARGAYSYVAAGALDARKQTAIPVENTLYFAGEATDQDGHAATVHGAIASGRRAAKQILSGLAATNG